MTDRFSGKAFSDPQSENIQKEVKARKFGKKKESKEDNKAPTNLSELYNKGIEHLKTFNFVVELNEGGDHVKHRILASCTATGMLTVFNILHRSNLCRTFRLSRTSNALSERLSLPTLKSVTSGHLSSVQKVVKLTF